MDGFDIYISQGFSDQSGYGFPDVQVLASELFETFPVFGRTLHNSVKEILPLAVMSLPFSDGAKLVVEMDLTILQGGIKVDWKIDEERSDSPKERDSWGALNAIAQYANGLISARHLQNLNELVLACHGTPYGDIIIGQRSVEDTLNPLFYAKLLIQRNSVSVLLRITNSQYYTKEEHTSLELEAMLLVLASLPQLYNPI